MKEFRDRVAVVTGGASGIGRAMAGRFAKEGMKIVLGDIERPALEKVVTELKTAGADVVGVNCDVADKAHVEALAGAAYEKFGTVHVVCNNAGVAAHAAPCWTVPDSDWNWVLGANLWGVIHGIRAFVPRMLAQGTEGHIVNTASLAGLLATPYSAPYNVAKFGVVVLTEILHYELAIAGSKLKASVLCPAWVRTKIMDSERNRPAGPGAEGPGHFDEKWAEAFRIRVNEGLEPAVVADRVLEAIRDERLYVWTHPKYKPTVQLRTQDILAGRTPDLAKMLGGLGEQTQKAVN